MNEDELRKYYDIYTNCWKMFRSFSNPVDKDEFWSDLISASDKIYKASGDNEFAKEIILATVSEIERISKR